MNDLTLGQKVKKYRKRSGMSQLDLEVAISASPGAISRIENDRVNPTKETLINISQQLRLNNKEAAALFNLDITNDISRFISLTKKLTTLDITQLLQNSVNEICYELDLIGAFIVLIKGDRIYSQTFTQTWYTELSLKAIGKPFNRLYVSLDDNSNYMVKCINEKKPIESENFYNFIIPAVNKHLAKILCNISTVKTGIAFPLINSNKKVIGAICYGKKRIESFDKELKILDEISSIIGISVDNAQEYNKDNI